MSDQSPFISINGIPDAFISPLDRGFAYGDGLFETCRIMCGQIPLWSMHCERLVQGCESLLIPIDVTLVESYRDKLMEESKRHGLRNGILKVIVTRGEGGRGYSLPEQISPTICIIIHQSPIDPSTSHEAQVTQNMQTQSGVLVRVCQQRLSDCPSLAGIKHLNRLEQILARAEWRDDHYAEGLLLDRNDHVIEATASNFFMVCDSRLYTPNLARSGVAGIMRRVIIEQLAPALNLSVGLTEISLAELYSADEIFLCNSVKGISPVSSIKGEKSVHFPAGKITHALQRQLNIFLQSLCSHNGARL